ncbi:MAG: putative hydro-lyase [Planctomycetaceae bacterium]|nr:putative hydro-lyase [Planctomycetaceae bacterium]
MVTNISPTSTGRDVRLACRRGEWTQHTSGVASNFAQANLVILPAKSAEDFRCFCERNPQPCPLLEMTQPGDQVPHRMASDVDLRTDLPRYRVWQDGVVTDEPTDISNLWRDDLVSFLIGCSFTFDSALLQAGLPVRHVEVGCNVPMFRTNIDCIPSGPFRGPLVVSMRPFTAKEAARANELTAGFSHFHGRPVHQGDPLAIGISDLAQPDFGDAVTLLEGEMPVFWACGVTPQCALESARLPLAITHAPGHMFVTDRSNAEILQTTIPNG